MYVVSKLFCMYVKLENVNGKMIYFLITSQTVTFFKVRCVLLFVLTVILKPTAFFPYNGQS